MSKSAGLPYVPISINELSVLERIVFTHKNYLVGNTCIAQENAITLRKTTDLVIFEHKTTPQPPLNHVKNTSMLPLTVAEIISLLDAVKFFSNAITKIIPASPERDAILLDIEGLRSKLIIIQSTSD